MSSSYDFNYQSQSNILCQINAAVIDFKISVFKLPVINLKAWKILQSLAQNCDLIFPYENVCLISARPRKLCFDDDNRLHDEKQTAIEFADGWFCEYFERGIKVTKKFDRIYVSKEQEIAANSNKLRKLADTEFSKPMGAEDKNILATIASNPNIPPDLLLHLFTYFPKFPGKVLNNPVLPLLLLEKPNSIDELLAYFYSVNCDYYRDSGLYLCWEKVPDLFWKYVLNPPNCHICAFIVSTFRIELPILEKFAADEYIEVRREVARNRHVTKAILEKLAADEYVDVRQMVANNENTPVAILEQLAKDEDKSLVSIEVEITALNSRNFLQPEIFEKSKVKSQKSKFKSKIFKYLSQNLIFS